MNPEWPDWVDQDWLYRRYIVEGKSVLAIAAELRLPKHKCHLVRDALVANFIPLRNKREISRAAARAPAKRRGPKSLLAAKAVARRAVAPAICAVCRAAPGVDVNHKDRNHFNNELKNLERLCKRCHSAHHAKERALALYAVETLCPPGRLFAVARQHTLDSEEKYIPLSAVISKLFDPGIYVILLNRVAMHTPPAATPPPPPTPSSAPSRITGIPHLISSVRLRDHKLFPTVLEILTPIGGAAIKLTKQQDLLALFDVPTAQELVGRVFLATAWWANKDPRPPDQLYFDVDKIEPTKGRLCSHCLKLETDATWLLTCSCGKPFVTPLDTKPEAC